ATPRARSNSPATPLRSRFARAACWSPRARPGTLSSPPRRRTKTHPWSSARSPPGPTLAAASRPPPRRGSCNRCRVRGAPPGNSGGSCCRCSRSRRTTRCRCGYRSRCAPGAWLPCRPPARSWRPQPRQQHFGLLVVKDVLLLGQDAVELSGGDVDAQLVQLFQEQWLGDVLVVILIDDETDQGRSEVAPGSDTFGQWGHQVPAVGTPPAFAAVTGDPRADLQILNHEVFVTFEGRSGGHVGQRDDDFVGDDQLGGLGPLGGAGPLLTRLTR